MNVDLEASGALATAGLAAKAIDDQSAPSNAHAASLCANCKATLLGAYCHVCGQTGHVHRSIWHMLEEGLHGVLHFDSKIWRTLPLLFARPGLLTRRYIDGQRVRYVSPLALFLFTIFLMFFVLSFAGSGGSTTQATPEEQKNARDEIVTELETAKAEVAKQSASIAAAPDEAARQKAAEDLEGAKIEQRAAEVQLSIFDKATALDADPSKTALVTAEELKALTGIQFDKGTSKAGDVLKDLTRNPELMIYKFRNTSYKFSFMLIPISLPFLWLMFFWKREITMYDHMVFSMYSLSFMSLLFVLIVLLGLNEFTSRLVSFLIWLPPLHMFLQLKETYLLSFGSALWRTFALLISAGTVFMLFLLMVIAITAM